ncbi:hypothetical protein [Eleftheria terrae]|uniref:hypothetical protein n=1 Tax=Eleftheria terrae TaxID=1597781 RepID=UPI00263A6D82|nr:hypothetical protein [Eleftheria terrae]WKB52519.1 hypothetical protein N7L95_22410 [Eleftheria terrae]
MRPFFVPRGPQAAAAALTLLAAAPAHAQGELGRAFGWLAFACVHLGLYLGALSLAFPRRGGSRSHTQWFIIVLLGYPATAYGVFSVVLLARAADLRDGATFLPVLGGAIAVQFLLWSVLALLFFLWRRKLRREADEMHSRIDAW